MEDIDAAVEDAEYVRAMREGVPQPSKGWEWMSGPNLDAYIDKLRKDDTRKLTLDHILGQNLGFYQVRNNLCAINISRLTLAS